DHHQGPRAGGRVSRRQDQCPARDHAHDHAVTGQVAPGGRDRGVALSLIGTLKGSRAPRDELRAAKPRYAHAISRVPTLPGLVSEASISSGATMWTAATPAAS